MSRSQNLPIGSETAQESEQPHCLGGGEVTDPGRTSGAVLEVSLGMSAGRS